MRSEISLQKIDEGAHLVREVASAGIHDPRAPLARTGLGQHGSKRFLSDLVYTKLCGEQRDPESSCCRLLRRDEMVDRDASSNGHANLLASTAQGP